MTETETRWAERVREWKASGQTAKQFAEGREFKGSTLTYWASELRKREGSGGRRERRAPQLRMARVVAKPSAADQEKVVVQVGAARVVVRRGFDATLLRQVVEALGGTS
jgi:hypothetical protein